MVVGERPALLLIAAILALIFAAPFAFADDFCAAQNHKDKFCGSFFEYQTVSVAEEKYKAFEKAVNDYAQQQAQNDKDWLQDDEADFPHLKDCNAVESWIIVNLSGAYLNATIIYWYFFGASPHYFCKSFTLDTEKNALVSLAEITGLSGEQIFDEVLRQLRENYELDEHDNALLSDILDNRDDYAAALEKQAFVFTDDGRIRLCFGSFDCFVKPNFEFFFDVKK